MSTLDPGKLTSVDENGDRIRLIPAEVRGYFHKRRKIVHGILLFIFLAIPWTTMNHRQTVLINIPDREFYLFGALFKAHDAPLLFFILAILGIGLAFITSVWGRVWCGWACPQTVFVESVFRQIEQWTEGNYIQRRQLRDAPFDFTKIRKVSLKWICFILVSLAISHSFMAYFVGAESLIEMMQRNPEDNWTYFLLTVAFTSVVLFDFAWFREQFCVIMCPYGRIQSLLLDQKSVSVVYDVARGEPRKGSVGDKKGDCVSCNRCVQVCPTGIDIRNGLQMECLSCTACIDACDEIMDKVKKPRGLIRYQTLDGSKLTWKRPRSIIYIILLLGLSVTLFYFLRTHSPTDWTVLRGAGLPYSYIKNEANEEIIQNQFKIHISNEGDTSATYELRLLGAPLGIQLMTGENPLTLNAGDNHEWFFFLRLPPTAFKGHDGKIKIKIQIRDLQSDFIGVREVTIVGPREL